MAGQKTGWDWTFTSRSPEETEEFGRRLAQRLQGGEVIALFGGMGRGKTAFTRGLAAGLGSRDPVSSPTFALVQEYAGRLPLYHFDMYRIESWDDLYSTGFFDYLESGGVLVIEWSENIEGALPAGCIRVAIEPGEKEHERVFYGKGVAL